MSFKLLLVIAALPLCLAVPLPPLPSTETPNPQAAMEAPASSKNEVEEQQVRVVDVKDQANWANMMVDQQQKAKDKLANKLVGAGGENYQPHPPKELLEANRKAAV